VRPSCQHAWRIKQISKVRLYRPRAGDPDAYPRLTAALTRPIRWDIVVEQYPTR